MAVTRIIGHLTRTGVSVVRHPVETGSYAAGLVKGAAYAVIKVASGDVRSGVWQVDPDPEADAAVPDQTSGEPTRRTAATAPTGERTLFGGLNREAAPPQMPGGGGEAYEHFPSPESRDAGHGDIAVDPREEASWTEGLDDVSAGSPDIESTDDTGAGVQQSDTEPLIDPATTKAVRSEAETLQRAADLDKS